MQHYLFAHVLLPGELFAEPGLFLETLLSPTGRRPEGARFLTQVWAEAGVQATDRVTVSAEGLDYSSELLGTPRAMVYLVRLPTPQRIAEAHFVAVVFDSIAYMAEEDAAPRYFTLECSKPETATVLGEWRVTRGEREYIEHGPGPQAEPHAFLAALTRVLALPPLEAPVA